MKRMQIKITGIHDAIDFVAAAAQVDGDINVCKGRYAVDGKSLLGIFSIDISTGCTVEYPETAIEFENYIKQFEESYQAENKTA